MLLTLNIIYFLFSFTVMAAEFKVKDGIGLNSRSGPGTTYQKRGRLKGGARLEELERRGNWSKVKTENGETVWVHNGFIYSSPAENKLQKNTRVTIQKNHQGPVGSAFISNDKRYMISTEKEGLSSLVWDIEEQKVVSALSPSGDVKWVELSPDGQHVVFLRGNGQVSLMDIYGDPVGYRIEGRFLPDFVAPNLVRISARSNFFSRDGKTFATYQAGKWVSIWDVATGKLIRRWKESSNRVRKKRKFNFVTIAPGHDRILIESVYNDKMDVRVVNLKDKKSKLLDDDIGKPWYYYGFSPSGNYINKFAGHSGVLGYDIDAKVWKSNSLEIVFEKETVDGRHIKSFLWSRDDKFFALNYETLLFRNRASVWSTSLLEKVSSVDFRSFPSSTVATLKYSPIQSFSDDGATLLTAGLPTMIETKTGKLLKKLELPVSEDSWALHLENNDFVTFSSLGNIEFTSSRIRAVENEKKELEQSYLHVSRAEWNDNQIFVQLGNRENSKGAVIWDTLGVKPEESKLLNFDGEESFRISFISDDGNYLFQNHKNSIKYKIGNIRNNYEKRTINYNYYKSTGKYGSPSVYRSIGGGKIAVGLDGWEQGIDIIDLGSRKMIQKYERRQSDDLRQVEMAVSPGALYIALMRSWSHYDETYDLTDLTVFDVATGEPVSRVMSVKGGWLEALSPDGKIALYSRDNNYGLFLVDTGTGEIVHTLEEFSRLRIGGSGQWFLNSERAQFSPDGLYVAAPAEDGVVRVWETSSGNLVRELAGHTGTVTSIDWSEDGDRILSGSQDGTVRVWSLSSGNELVKLIMFSKDAWIAITPHGFFHASPQGSKRLTVSLDPEILPIDRFYDALYRPDLVLEALKGDPAGLVRKTAEELNLAIVWQSGAPPEVTSIASSPGLNVEFDKIDVVAELEAKSGDIGRVEIKVNGATQIVENIPQADIGRSSVKISQSVFLTPGKNQIEVTAYNRANLIASGGKTIEVTSTAEPREKPTLHILAVGVDEYADQQITQLNYAVNDANAIGDAFSKSGSDVYENVKLTKVLNNEATKENLDRVFAGIGAVARPEDVFVFFLSGHGKTEDGRYYFLPPNFKYEDEHSFEESGIGQSQWQQWMARVPAQKSILLYDTCESGSLIRDQTSEGLEVKSAIDRMTRATGRTILTAATDTEPALEGYGGHGVFSYLVLEALGVADKDADGQLEVTELASHVETELPEVSYKAFKHRQIPQFSISGYSFTLGKPILVLNQAAQ